MPPAESIPLPRRITQLVRVGSRVTDQRIEQLLQQGQEILPLSAYPSRPLPTDILQQAQQELSQQDHPLARGLFGLRQALAEYWQSRSGRSIDPEKEVLVTCGAMHGLMITLLALLDPGDEVLLFTPSYFFEGLIELAGAKLRPIPLNEEEGFRWRPDLLEKAIGPRSRVILLNTPTNPTGTVANLDTLQAIAEIAERHGLYIVCDESYDRLIYGGARHVSILASAANRGRNVLVSSFTKSFSMAAWRVGYVIASPPIADAVLKVLEWSVLFGPYINQRVAELVLRGDHGWLEGISKEFQANRDGLVQTLKSSARLSVVLPQGNPFVFVNVQRLGRSDEVVASLLLERFGIPCTAGRLHGAPGYVRIAFGGASDTVDEAGRRILQAEEDCKSIR